MERPPVLGIGYLLLSANRMLGARAASRVRELGLTPQQAVALLAIDSNPARQATPGQVAEFMAADSPTVSGVVSRLEQRGYVRVIPNPADKRSRLITLTSAAEAVLPEIRESIREASAWAESVMPAEELDELTGLLERFVHLLSSAESS